MDDTVVDQLVDLVHSARTAKAAVSNFSADELVEVSAELKKRALFYLRRDAPMAMAIADLILSIGRWENEPRIEALGLQTKAIALTLAQREFETALTLFAESEEVYRQHGAEHEIAVGQISRVWALACLQRFDEAFVTGEETARVLEAHADYMSLAALNNNLAAIYGRRGQDRLALQRILDVEAAYGRLGEEGQRRMALALGNKAIVLRNLGRYAESIAATQASLELARAHSQTVNVARAEQNLGITYFLLGRFARAQTLLERARETFISDQRYQDAILCDLYLSEGLLHLQRYEDALAKSRQVIEIFEQAGTPFEVAQALLNEAAALTGLGAHEEALASLGRARRIFANEDNDTWAVYTDLEEAAVLYRQRRYARAEQLAAAAMPQLHAQNLPLKEALAIIIAARAAFGAGRLKDAQIWCDEAQTIAQAIDVPLLSYQAGYLQGQLALAREQHGLALAAYDSAIRELERLQGQIMVEFRADFLADKDEVYSHAVDLCLEAQNARVALGYAERSKSRALLAMLSHHVNLGIEARSPADQPLVDRILSLRDRRDRLYRRWETGETPGSSVNREEEQESIQQARDAARHTILETEDEIRDLWHSLLVRNTAYSRDASLWQVQTRLEQEALDEETLLVEFFNTPRGLVVFLVSAGEVQARRLPARVEAMQREYQKLLHNFSTLRGAPQLASAYGTRAKRILQNFHEELVAPWIDAAKAFKRLVIVPHGLLHYLPFQAFYDGEVYLLERFAISYLPGSSFLDFPRPPAQLPLQTLIMGHSQNGRLPQVCVESESVAALFNDRPYLDGEATRARFQQEAPAAAVLHVAAHGDFQPANPLFSGLHLEDGRLTTLDVFNLRLNASLATLSACQTGLNQLGGGDELFGLTRAFLASGTDSLILTLWAVEDETTTRLMVDLYGRLLAGASKVEALRQAQIGLLNGGGAAAAHPYYWAPFFLVGDVGPLLEPVARPPFLR